MPKLKEYWGFKQISQRMGWKSHDTLLRRITQDQFPVYKRRINNHGYKQKILYTNENMITLWEITQAKEYRESLLSKDNKANTIRKAYIHRKKQLQENRE